MKLINSKALLEEARAKKYAVPQFNINNLEWTKCLMEISQKKHAPLILGVTKNVVTYNGGCYTIACFVKGLLKDLNIDVPVVLHLDHGRTYEACIEAADAGFTSIMVGTDLCSTLEEKIDLINRVVSYARPKGISIETDLGSFESKDIPFTVEDSIEVLKRTNVDSFAPALGTKHGMVNYKINFERMEKLYNLIDIPMVLHGGSGVTDKDIRHSISLGFSKININTENMVLWADAVRKFVIENPDEHNPKKIIGIGLEAMEDNIKHRIDVLYTSNLNEKI